MRVSSEGTCWPEKPSSVASHQRIKNIFFIFFISFIPSITSADPWFTGPLLALPGQTVPRGHINASWSVATALSNAIYDRDWKQSPQPAFKSVQINPEFIYGLADRFDIQYDGFYFINENDWRSYEHIGDTSVMLGFQALTQEENNTDLRITLQEILPTGIYNHLTAINNGTNITGMGSYQTALGLNFQYLTQFDDIHYLNSHLSFMYSHAATVQLNGISAYGGNALTNGRIAPGDSMGIDIAGEYTLTQHWGAVLEGTLIYQQASKFQGQIGERTANDPLPIDRNNRLSKMANRLFPSKHNIGGSGIGNGTLDQITLAPGIEYNFSVNYGVVAGAWFTVAGKNTPVFVAPMILFNAYW